MTLIERAGGRKFLATISCGATTAFLQWSDKLDTAGNTYMLVIVATVGAFITGNVMQKKHTEESGGEKP